MGKLNENEPIKMFMEDFDIWGKAAKYQKICYVVHKSKFRDEQFQTKKTVYFIVSVFPPLDKQLQCHFCWLYLLSKYCMK